MFQPLWIEPHGTFGVSSWVWLMGLCGYYFYVRSARQLIRTRHQCEFRFGDGAEKIKTVDVERQLLTGLNQLNQHRITDAHADGVIICWPLRKARKHRLTATATPVLHDDVPAGLLIESFGQNPAHCVGCPPAPKTDLNHDGLARLPVRSVTSALDAIKAAAESPLSWR
ncbi:hypothetical protein [Celeribacter arenosi]|uniref:Uncharacterized protein n=1 Tax=Celeribacter arenosi TaxID=792649 RepID=A0ABP7KBB6_9RHOB